MHSLRHRLVRSRQYASAVVLGFWIFGNLEKLRACRHDCREAGDVWVTLVKTSNVEYFYEKLIDTP